jgi:hypothetical protein
MKHRALRIHVSSRTSPYANLLHSAAEFALGALRAVEDELLLRSGVDPVGLPALTISWKPDLPALLTQWNDGDVLRASRPHFPTAEKSTQASVPRPTHFRQGRTRQRDLSQRWPLFVNEPLEPANSGAFVAPGVRLSNEQSEVECVREVEAAEFPRSCFSGKEMSGAGSRVGSVRVPSPEMS